VGSYVRAMAKKCSSDLYVECCGVLVRQERVSCDAGVLRTWHCPTWGEVLLPLMSVRSIAITAVSAVAQIRIKDSARAELRIGVMPLCATRRGYVGAGAHLHAIEQRLTSDDANRESCLFSSAGRQRTAR
jgi:hypothetical protein